MRYVLVVLVFLFAGSVIAQPFQCDTFDGMKERLADQYGELAVARLNGPPGPSGGFQVAVYLFMKGNNQNPQPERGWTLVTHNATCDSKPVCTCIALSGEGVEFFLDNMRLVLDAPKEF